MLHRFFVFQGSDRLVCTPSKLHALVAETARICDDAQLLKVGISLVGAARHTRSR
jgi:hypothetical protein